jgi:hydrogenase small subunit
MPGFPDKFMPFMEPDEWGKIAANVERFTAGPIVRYFRNRNIKGKYDIEPEWRKPGNQILSGYKSRTSAYAPPGS